MTVQTKIRTLIALTVLALEAWALYTLNLSPAYWRPAMIVKNEPRAHALYDTMNHTMRDAKSLSYTAVSNGLDGRATTYKIYLKKPHAFRVEVTNHLTKRTTMLVRDKDHLWIYWSGKRQVWEIDTVDSYGETQSDTFIKKAASATDYSITNEIASLGMAWYNLVWDPGLFHGHLDPHASFVDGVRSKGKDTVRGHLCDVIEISFMKAQRTRYIWLSRQDHLPRKIKEIDRLADNHVTVVRWSNVGLNHDIAPTMLTWSPPETSKPWHLPQPEASLLESGQAAPDFTLDSIDKEPLSLSDFRGKAVWLYLWQVGSPSCREEMPLLQSFYESCKDKGLVILGLNHTDDRRIAQFFLQTSQITFPNILDSSKAALKVTCEGYGYRGTNMPLSYIIDREGRIVDAWYGFEAGRLHARRALKRVGIQLENGP